MQVLDTNRGQRRCEIALRELWFVHADRVETDINQSGYLGLRECVEEGFGISAGSACRSGSTSTSPILRALYGPEAERFAPMRLSLGWSTTAEEVEEAIRNIPPIIERIRGST